MIIQLFQELVNDQKKIISLLERHAPSDMDDPAKWLSPEKTMKHLTVSERTLYTLRKNNEITWRKKGRRYFYFEPDIFRIRDHHLK